MPKEKKPSQLVPRLRAETLMFEILQIIQRRLCHSPSEIKFQDDGQAPGSRHKPFGAGKNFWLSTLNVNFHYLYVWNIAKQLIQRLTIYRQNFTLQSAPFLGISVQPPPEPV